MDYSDLRAKLLQNKDKPAIINVTIGTTFKGAIDVVDVILETLKECGYSQDRFYIHFDAALCGLMTPFVNNFQESNWKCHNFWSQVLRMPNGLWCPNNKKKS
uniref:Uncharacterized protein n=1 Tax=Solanum lycopersicum TaxID=4081 RepID=A0A3Q7JBS5_SOLLC